VKKTALVAVLLSLAVLSPADSPSWPCWRGAGHDGVSTETGWDPLALKDGARVLWKADVGPGYSDMAIQDGRLYTMGMDEEKCSVLCLDALTGKVIWRTSFPTHGEPMATPCVDGDRLYAVDNGGNVLCLRAADGALLWKKSLRDELEVIVPYYGWASAPLVDGRLLLLNANRSGLALDKMTGETVWSSPNDYRKWSASYGSYSSPVPLDFEGTGCVLLYGPAGP
jgi:outer membrane protein assembly factor BamB